MKILFVYNNLQIGGIETLILRMAMYLSGNGHEVHLMLKERSSEVNLYSNDELLEQIRQYAHIIYAGDNCRDLLKCTRIILPCYDYDYIYGFDTTSFLVGLILAQHNRIHAPVIAGVYHPREYCFKRQHPRYMPYLMEKILHSIPSTNIFFMNQACRVLHSACVQRDFELSPIIPLPIDTKKFSTIQRTSINRLKIVSIGRIVNFKTYNFTMVEVIKKLIQKGYQVEYHIYGRGYQKHELMSYIEKVQLHSNIFVHNIVEYDKMSDVLKDAGLFIGMGTSLVEAAACGVPSLIAIESNPKPTTYGFFHEVNYDYNVGEVVQGLVEYPFLDKIEYLLNTSNEEYTTIEKKTRLAAEKFGLSQIMTIFIESLQKSQYFVYPISLSMRLIYSIDNFMWRFLRSRFIKIPDPLALQYGQARSE